MQIELISHPLAADTPLYGGRRKVRITTLRSIEQKDASNSLMVNFPNHASTHIDAPYHFLAKGKTVTDYDSSFWVFKHVIILDLNIGMEGVLTEKDFEGLGAGKETDLLILRTGHEEVRGKREYVRNSPVVSSELAGFFKKKLPNLRAIGFDFISLSSLKNREEGRRAHRAFLKAGILIVEDMKLSGLISVPDFILVSPLFIEGADGSPVSVWAFYEDCDIEKCDHLFFDFDGVILDSVGVKTDAFKTMYRKYGTEIMNKVAKHHVENGGMSRYDKFRHYHNKFLDITLDEKEVDALAEKFSEIVFQKVLRTKFIGGALDFLKMCKRRKKTCFLVSAAPEGEIKEIIKLRKLKKYFVEIKGSPEKKANNIRKLMKEYKVKRDRAVFFGDSINDVRAANPNGIKFVDVNYGNSSMWHKDFKGLLAKEE